MKFLCGCDLPLDRVRLDPELTSLETLAYDNEGFVICRPHRQRRQGWLSLPTLDGPAGKRADFSMSSLTPLTIERIVVFQEIPSSYDIPSLDVKSGAEDRRDNRHPLHVGESLLMLRTSFSDSSLSQVYDSISNGRVKVT